MHIKKILITVSAFAVMGFSASCAKPSSIEETCSAESCSERDVNAPIDDNEDHSIPAPETPPAPNSSRDFSYIDPENIVPEKPLALALAYYEANSNKITNKNYVTVIDFTRHSSKKRLFLINMSTGAVTAMLTSAGRYSDPDGDGYATLFSNVPESGKSSLGYYLTGATYQGGHGLSLRLHGKSETNSNAYDRLIVMHGADYVREEDTYAGRSLGCPALDNNLISGVIGKVKGGSLIYAWHEKYSTERL